MRNTLRLTLLAFVVSLGVSEQAHAQGATPTPRPANTPIRFIDMEEMLLTAGIIRPSAAFFATRQRVRFESLMNLRHDVIGALRTTACDASLR